MFSCELCEISKNIFFTEHFQWLFQYISNQQKKQKQKQKRTHKISNKLYSVCLPNLKIDDEICLK